MVRKRDIRAARRAKARMRNSRAPTLDALFATPAPAPSLDQLLADGKRRDNRKRRRYRD